MAMATLPLGLKQKTGNDVLERWLAALEAYDFGTITASCVEKYKWPAAKAKKIERETKQFLSLALLDPGYYHIPQEDVDEYWHRMILHSQWYHEFCNKFFGGYYHHTPTPDPDLVNEDNRSRSKKLAKHWFGVDWKTLVVTCTQCKGPGIVGYTALDLRPRQNVLP